MYDDNIPDEFDLDVRLTGSSSTLTSAVGTLYVPGGDETQEGCDVVETMDSCGFMGCGDIETQALPDCGGGGDTENPLLCGGGGEDTQELLGCGGGGGDTENLLLCGGGGGDTQELFGCGGGDTENPLLCGGGGGGGDTQELFGCGGGGGDTDNPLLCGGETMRCE